MNFSALDVAHERLDIPARRGGASGAGEIQAARTDLRPETLTAGLLFLILSQNSWSTLILSQNS